MLGAYCSFSRGSIIGSKEDEETGSSYANDDDD